MKFLDVPQSGSIADRTHSHNRAGQYTRNRRAPVQPVGSGRRATIRSAFGSGSAAWSALTQPQRDAWSAYADDHPYTDTLGQSIKLTGHQMFVGIYTQCVNAGLTLPTVPPTDSSVAGVGAITLTAAAATPALSVAYTPGTTGQVWLFAMSPQTSAGRSSPSRWWQHSNAAADESSPNNLLTLYVAEFGTLQKGKKIFLKVTPVNEFGVTGVASVTSCIVAT